METHPEQEATAQSTHPLDWDGLYQPWMASTPEKDRATTIREEEPEENAVAEKGYD